MDELLKAMLERLESKIDAIDAKFNTLIEALAEEEQQGTDLEGKALPAERSQTEEL